MMKTKSVLAILYPELGSLFRGPKKYLVSGQDCCTKAKPASTELNTQNRKLVFMLCHQHLPNSEITWKDCVGKCTWGSADLKTDWQLASCRIGNAILVCLYTLTKSNFLKLLLHLKESAMLSSSLQTSSKVFKHIIFSVPAFCPAKGPILWGQPIWADTPKNGCVQTLCLRINIVVQLNDKDKSDFGPSELQSGWKQTQRVEGNASEWGFLLLLKTFHKNRRQVLSSLAIRSYK